MNDTVRISRRPGHLLVELDSPDGANRLTPALVEHLLDALDTAEADPDCRAFVLAARGPHFCAGGDLKALTTAGFTATATGFAHLLERVATSGVATVAVVEGAATGGGSGLAAACDIVLAHPAATFRLTEVCFGMLPTMIMPAIARRIGSQRALRLAMLATPVTGEQALQFGWVDQLTEDPRRAVNGVLLALRRSDRATIADLKQAHQVLFPVDDRYARLAERVFGARISDPAVAERIRSFAGEGML